MRIICILFFVLCLSFCCFAQQDILLIDDFENEISGGLQGTVDFGAGGGSDVKAEASEDIVHSGRQSLKITYDAVAGGYMWVARGFELDASNTAWLLTPDEIEWDKYNALAFYMYGSNSGADIAFDIKDNGGEMWRSYLSDDFSGWKKIILPFDEFFARDDWQPDSADTNSVLDFPIKSYQFEPRPQVKGALYVDDVELMKK